MVLLNYIVFVLYTERCEYTLININGLAGGIYYSTALLDSISFREVYLINWQLRIFSQL